MTDYNDLMIMYYAGMIGPVKDYVIAYTNYAMLFNLTETLPSVHFGKKYKAKKPQPFSKIFSQQNEFITNNVNDRSQVGSGERFAMMLSAGAPKHILEKLKRNADARSKSNSSRS